MSEDGKKFEVMYLYLRFMDLTKKLKSIKSRIAKLQGIEQQDQATTSPMDEPTKVGDPEKGGWDAESKRLEEWKKLQFEFKELIKEYKNLLLDWQKLKAEEESSRSSVEGEGADQDPNQQPAGMEDQASPEGQTPFNKHMIDEMSRFFRLAQEVQGNLQKKSKLTRSLKWGLRSRIYGKLLATAVGIAGSFPVPFISNYLWYKFTSKMLHHQRVKAQEELDQTITDTAYMLNEIGEMQQNIQTMMESPPPANKYQRSAHKLLTDRGKQVFGEVHRGLVKYNLLDREPALS